MDGLLQRGPGTDARPPLLEIVGAATDAIIVASDEQDIILFNPGAQTMFRCQAREVIGRPLELFVPERFRAIFREQVKAIRESGLVPGTMGGQPLPAMRADGEEFPVEAAIIQVFVAGQRQFIAVVRDISERCRSEQALLETVGRLRAVLQTAVDGIITLDEAGRITSFNPAATRIFGYSQEEVMGRNVNLLLSDSHHQEHDNYLVRRGGTDVNEFTGLGREVTGRRKDGTACPVDLAVSETLLGDQRSFTWIVRDIKDRRFDDDAHAKLAALVESSDDAIISKTLGGIIATWNAGAERIFGYTAAEVVGRPISILTPRRLMDEAADIQQSVVDGQRMDHIETVRVAKDGREIHVSLNMSLIKDSAGIDVGASCIIRDISARKRADEELARQTEELARSNLELERFAYVASHDLQEPMRTVNSFAQLLKRRCADELSSDGKEYLGFITDGVLRMQNLIRDLLAYSRITCQGVGFGPVDCNEVLSEVVDGLHASIQSANARVTADALPVITADATQIGQLFQNLLTNAVKFHGMAPPRVHVSAKEAHGAWDFSFKDNGIGIDSEYFERIFVMFQRLHTSEEYAGTGIGLAICQKIVERHGGRIWVESEAGKGSTFHFRLPRRAEPT
jgi:PAS domain S-box-containing protein